MSQGIRLAFLLACLLVAAPASAQVWVRTDAAQNSVTGPAMTVSTSTTIDVAANEAILVCTYNLNGAIVTVTDGTHTYVGLTQRDYGGVYVRLFYTLSTSAGSFTPMATSFAAADYFGLYAASYSHTGRTANFVTENGGNGSSDTIDTGNITTTGASDLLTVACAMGSGLVAQSAFTINGAAATSSDSTAFSQSIWDLRNHSSATGAAVATIGFGDNWAAVIGAWSASVVTSSGGPQVGSVASVGAGR